jgi:hypothetical protein
VSDERFQNTTPTRLGRTRTSQEHSHTSDWPRTQPSTNQTSMWFGGGPYYIKSGGHRKRRKRYTYKKLLLYFALYNFVHHLSINLYKMNSALIEFLSLAVNAGLIESVQDEGLNSPPINEMRTQGLRDACLNFGSDQLQTSFMVEERGCRRGIKTNTNTGATCVHTFFKIHENWNPTKQKDVEQK